MSNQNHTNNTDETKELQLLQNGFEVREEGFPCRHAACDHINLSELSSLFWINSRRTTADFCGWVKDGKTAATLIAFFFFLPSPNWQQAGSPFVLMELREDRALKCVLNVLNGTPDAFQRQTKEQLITCNWANWNQRSACVDEWWWALRGRDTVTLNHFHGRQLSVFLTELFDPSLFVTKCFHQTTFFNL